MRATVPLTLLTGLLAACAQPAERTQLLVVVHASAALTASADQVLLTVSHTDGDPHTETVELPKRRASWPFSFGVQAAAERAYDKVKLEFAPQDNAKLLLASAHRTLARHAIELDFVAGETRLLSVFLDGSCESARTCRFRSASGCWDCGPCTSHLGARELPSLAETGRQPETLPLCNEGSLDGGSSDASVPLVPFDLIDLINDGRQAANTCTRLTLNAGVPALLSGGEKRPGPADGVGLSEAVTIELNGSSPEASIEFFSDAACTEPIDQVVIAQGKTQATYYARATLGPDQLNATVTQLLIPDRTVVGYEYRGAPWPARATDVDLGDGFTCAAIDERLVQCVGRNDFGQLGSPADSVGAYNSAWQNVPLPMGQVHGVAAGHAFACARVDESIFCWGASARGQCGVMATQALPTQVVAAGATALSAGPEHACAVVEGAVHCWGANQSGQLGEALLQDRESSTKVPGLEDTAVGVDTGGGAELGAAPNGTGVSCAWLANGAARCWGDNRDGLIDSSAPKQQPIATPVPVTGLTDRAVQLAVGQAHACAVIGAGSVTCWGKLGDAAYTTPRHDPPGVTELFGTAARLVAAGYSRSCAATSRGVYCWGERYPRDTVDWSAPQLFSIWADSRSFDYATSHLSVGPDHSCIIADDILSCLGSDAYGESGSAVGPYLTADAAPVAFPHGVDVQTLVAVSGAGEGTHTCAVARTTPGADFALTCWGDNGFGQVDPERASDHVAVEPSPLAILADLGPPEALALGPAFSCGTFGGSVLCWGKQVDGRPGSRSLRLPTRVLGLETGVTSIGAGTTHACAIEQEQVQCWGRDDLGQLGDGTADPPEPGMPVQVQGLAAGSVEQLVVAGDHACVLIGGGVQCWGSRAHGVLGDGSRVGHSPVPVWVSGLDGTSGTTVTQIAATLDGGCALSSEHEVLCWGEDVISVREDDQLEPVAIAEVAGAERIGGGGHVMCALMQDGLYCWGRNTVGELGRGTISHSEEPGKVIGLPLPITQFALGGEGADAYGCAASGTDLHCWGSDAHRQLGGGNPTQLALPTMPLWADPSPPDDLP